MVVDSIKQLVCSELMFCESRRDVVRAMLSAQKHFVHHDVTLDLRQEVLSEIRATLPHWLVGGSEPKRGELILEGELMIDALLLANSRV